MKKLFISMTAICFLLGIVSAQQTPISQIETKKPANLYQGKELQRQSLPKLGGATAYAQIINDGDVEGYCSFDINNIHAFNIIRPDLPLIYGGTYYDGKVYAYGTGGMFYIFDPYTGKTIFSKYIDEIKNKLVNGMAYDYTTNTMYATYGESLYTVNLTTGDLTFVAQIQGTEEGCALIPFAIDWNGKMYVINMGSANLYSVNKNTGSTTLIGSTGMTAAYAQSMTFDHSSGTLYWAHTNAYTDNFMKINTTTGAATMVTPNTYEMNALFFPFDTASNSAPAAVNNFAVTPASNGSLNINVSWNNPTLTVAGTTLASISNVKLYMNGVYEDVVNNPPVGSAYSYNKTVATPGYVHFRAIASNSAGNGTPKTEIKWIGPDVPEAPANLNVVASGNDMIVSWTAPTIGLHGGWFNPATLTYKIVRNPGNITVASAHTGTSFTDHLTGLNNYTYTVTSVNGAGTGGSASFGPIFGGGSLSIPYSMGFEDSEYWGVWTIVNDGNPGGTGMNGNWQRTNEPDGSNFWSPHTGSYFLRHYWSYGNTDDDWVFSPALPLETGVEYLVKFYVRKLAAWSTDEKLELFLASDVTPSSVIGSRVWYNEAFTPTYAEYAVPVTVAATGNYTFAFHKYGGGVFGDVCLDDFSVELLTSEGVPATSLVDMGSVPNNLPRVAIQGAVIGNTGGAAFTVTGLVSVSDSRITVSGLPITVEPFISDTFKVHLNCNGLPTGTFNGNIIVSTNAPGYANVMIPITANAAPAAICNLVQEDFTTANGYYTNPPAGWVVSNGFFRQIEGGVGDGACLRGNISAATTSIGVIQPCYVEMGNHPIMSFKYKVTDFALGGTPNPADGDKFKFRVLVSEDYGQSFHPIHSVAAGQHVATLDFTTVNVNVTPYANKTCLFLIEYECVLGNIYVYLDDINIGTISSTTYTVNLVADPVEGGNVSGAGNFAAGQFVTVKATANAGYYFVNWKDDINFNTPSDDNEYTFMMPASNVNLRANFDETTTTYEISIAHDDKGILRVFDGTTEINDGESVLENTVVEITVEAIDYVLTGVFANGGEIEFNTEGRYFYTVNSNVIFSFTADDVSINSLLPQFDVKVYSRMNYVYIVNDNNIPLKSVQLMDLLGRTIYQGEAGFGTTMFSANVATGHYIVRLISEDDKVHATKVYLIR